jgi:RNA polymerase sigma factor (sigma-70 family)
MPNLTPNELFENNMNLVYGYIRKHEIHIDSLEYDDLYQEGFLALFKACEKFDPSKGVQFNTFATTCIANHFTDLIRHNSRLIHPMITDPSAFDEVDIYKDTNGTMRCADIDIKEENYDDFR